MIILIKNRVNYFAQSGEMLFITKSTVSRKTIYMANKAR